MIDVPIQQMKRPDKIKWTHSLNFSDNIGVWSIPPSGEAKIGVDEEGNIHIQLSGETSLGQMESFIKQMETLFIQLKSTLRHDPSMKK
jgi:hypothetical protein